MTQESAQTLMSISREDGVKDLPSKVRGQFALATKEERSGNHEKALTHLEKALALCD